MAGLINELVSGVVDSVLKEILKKTRTGTTKRKKRQARTATGQFKKVRSVLKSRAQKKQVSRRKTTAARSKTRRT